MSFSCFSFVPKEPPGTILVIIPAITTIENNITLVCGILIFEDKGINCVVLQKTQRNALDKNIQTGYRQYVNF